MRYPLEVQKTRFISCGCIALSLALSGCGSSDEPTDAPDDGSEGQAVPGSEAGESVSEAPGEPVVAPAEGTSVTPLVGVVDIQLKAPVENDIAPLPGFATISGRVHDGLSPSPIRWMKAGEASGCELQVPSSPFCEDGCSSSAACTDDNICTPYPTTMNAGEITVTGIETTDGETSVTLSPLPPSNSYQLIGATLNYPPFPEGQEITLANAEGEIGTISAKTSGIAPLIVTQEAVVFAEGSTADIAWEPATSDASRVHVTVDISHHGGLKGEIRCDVPDTGSLEIPVDLVDGLIDLGFSGFPTVHIERRSETITASMVGGIAFRTSADVTLPIEIPGLTSCSDPGTTEECPAGETCQADLKCAP